LLVALLFIEQKRRASQGIFIDDMTTPILWSNSQFSQSVPKIATNPWC